jgi:hypothetical protein
MIKPRVVGPGARDRTSRASKRNGKVTRWARFPMTLFLAMEYGLLVIYPAWQHRRPFPSFVFVVPLVVIAIAAYVEWLAKRLSVRRSTKPFPTSRFGFGIGLVGVLATLIQSLLGAGTYAVQVGSDSVSPLANIFTPFASLAQIGAALVIYGWYRGTCTRGRALARLGSLVVMQFAIAVLLIGTTAPAYSSHLQLHSAGSLPNSLVPANSRLESLWWSLRGQSWLASETKPAVRSQTILRPSLGRQHVCRTTPCLPLLSTLRSQEAHTSRFQEYFATDSYLGSSTSAVQIWTLCMSSPLPWAARGIIPSGSRLSGLSISMEDGPPRSGTRCP